MPATPTVNLTHPDIPAAPKKEEPAKLTPTQEFFKKYPEFQNLYTMFYRHGMSVSVSKTFYHPDSHPDRNVRIKNAVDRARAHCKVMNYHYIFLLPLINDIDAHENYKLNGIQSQETIL